MEKLEAWERVQVFVPTRGHVWNGTAAALTAICLENGLFPPVYVRGVTGTADVRNEIVRHFLDGPGQILVMCDDDVIPPRSFLEIIDPIEQGDADVVGCPVPIMRPGTTFMPNIFKREGDEFVPSLDAYQAEPGSAPIEVDAIGTGCIAISRKLLEDHHFRVPFRPRYDKDGTWRYGEDVTFCMRAKAQGYKVMADLNQWCEHLSELHCNAIAVTYMSLLKELMDGEAEENVEAAG